MERIKITTADHPFFSSLWEIYESAFPLCERRGLEDQILVFSNDTYHMEAWIEGDDLLGFIGWWDSRGIRYVEHYAIHPDARSSGYGSKFLTEWMNDNDIMVLLEIEPVTDDISRRRESFYHRLGFKSNNIDHWHPPYHKGMGKVYLWVMSYPTPIPEQWYQDFIRKQRSEINPLEAS